ncbi:sarcosine oxidase subunit alpha family protein [Shimia sediminis]|uniref:sarcosine oxidase subunit alpha family protein n=1 Tax=Shimia sediminis TaxID=2497945 RepID=UPI000F8F7D02|nr:sarcosine oxidase subunit alpha family protein [Shimia sediminis]
MTQKLRLDGGRLDRTKALNFTFDGQAFQGYEGDTLASALMANGVRLIGRSFKYHRPRGVFTSGSEEPNALVELRSDARQEPNTRATVAELFDGLDARSQNRGPSLRWDPLAINDLFSNFLTAGFYYKTFMWPKSFWEKLYEPAIRRAAGLGSLSMQDDPDEYDKGFLHCDLLVIGAGPAGLMAAQIAGRAGARVIVADEDFLMGGRLNAERQEVGGMAGHDWAASVVSELHSMDNVRVMPRTSIIGAYDHGTYGAVERVQDHIHTPVSGKPRQILWRIYSKRAVLCAGATERPIAFPNNDRPGISLAASLRAYANRWATAPASRVAVFTNNDDGHRTAADLMARGVDVAAVVDVRQKAAKLSDARLIAGAQVIGTKGRQGLKSIRVRHSDGRLETISCGALGVSGGWNPNVHMTCHQNGRPVWDEDIAAFVPGADLPPGMSVAGAAKGLFTTTDALRNGAEEASAILSDLGFASGGATELPQADDAAYEHEPIYHVTHGKGRAWLDLQNDVTVKDVKLAHQENFRSVEHLKRYTTLGMATDQGKTSNVGALAVMAELTGKSIPETGTTVFRPPYTPVTVGAFGGRSVGAHYRPIRKTPSHKWAEENGAPLVRAGNWLRARWFPKSGETHWRESVDREVMHVRSKVGICDVSTLGKIDVQGADAAAFLNKVYANGFAKLAVGKVRYGLMLREEGILYDDGTAARLGEDHFVITTTTANAALVLRNMEFARQCLWPDMDVQLISTTEAWAQFAVAGPKSRELLQRVVDEKFDITNETFPFMACGELSVCDGLRARLFRISFSGELAYEIAVPARYGAAMWRRMLELGKDLDVIPYGVEALDVMRIEKGHPTGRELDGTTTALNMGMERMVSRKKDSIGSVLDQREGMIRTDGLRLVGLKPVNTSETFTAGTNLVNDGAEIVINNDQGRVTSACFSPSLGHCIGLALLKNGDARMGEVVRVVSPAQNTDVKVEVTTTHFFDPDGGRLRA